MVNERSEITLQLFNIPSFCFCSYSVQVNEIKINKRMDEKFSVEETK